MDLPADDGGLSMTELMGATAVELQQTAAAQPVLRGASELPDDVDDDSPATLQRRRLWVAKFHARGSCFFPKSISGVCGFEAFRPQGGMTENVGVKHLVSKGLLMTLP